MSRTHSGFCGLPMLLCGMKPSGSFWSGYRRLNSQRSVFPSDMALLKALYLATFEATKKWMMPIRNWGRVYGELAIMYNGRLPD